MQQAQLITDYELIAKHIAGDTRAFGEIMRRYEDLLRKRFVWYLRWLEPDVRLATIDDLLQEMWFKVLRAAPLMKEVDSFEAWLLTVSRNLVLDELKRRRRSPLRVVDGWELSPAVQPGIEREVEAKDMLAKILDYLSDHTASGNFEVLKLVIAGYSPEEISQLLHITIGNVKMRLYRARVVARAYRDENR